MPKTRYKLLNPSKSKLNEDYEDTSKLNDIRKETKKINKPYINM